MKAIALKDWLEEAERRFGTKDPRKWVFICAACGHVQSGADFAHLGIPGWQDKFYFNCIGRYDGHEHVVMGTKPGPCNYTSGGLLVINGTRVETPDGAFVPVFEFGDPLAADSLRPQASSPVAAP